jgi:single-strand DNA-binding protein
MNIFTFSGNLVKDARTQQSQSGTSMCFFTVAVNSGYGDKQHVDYVECAIFGKRAEGGLIQYLKKGKQVLISGEVQLKSREHEGKTYTNMNVSVDKIYLVGGKPAQQPQQQPQQQAPQSNDQFKDDIPF